MKRKLPAWLILTVITAASGLLLGMANGVTTPIIEENNRAVADGVRALLFPQAESFREMELLESAQVDSCFEALRGEEVAGHVCMVTVKGYGGDIEVTVGILGDGTVTGIQVGGANFSETAGLGARAKEPAFTGQFAGKTTPLALNKDVDSITGASISSGAVVSAVNKAALYIANLGKNPAEMDPYGNMLPAGATELAHDETVDSAYKTPDGYVVYVTQQGFHGPIHVAVALDEQGVVSKVAIDQVNFNETAGLGERVLEDWFLAQYIGKTGVIGVNPVASEDGASSATGESGTAEGKADEGDAASYATEQSSAGDATEQSSAGDATEQSSAGDATSQPTTVVEVIEGNTWIDSVSGATISSTTVTKAVNAAIAFVQAQK